MGDDSTQDQDHSRFAEVVDELWNDPATRARVGAMYGIGDGNYWLFRLGLRTTIIRLGRLNDRNYLDGFLEDTKDRLRGDTKKKRDNWFEWSGDEFDPFRRWVHREKKPRLPIDEQNKPFTRPQVKEWWDEWEQMGDRKKSMYEIDIPFE